MMENWKVYTVGELYNVQNGYAFRSQDFYEFEKVSSYEVLKIGHIGIGGGLRKEPKRMYVDRDPKYSKWVLNQGDIVMGMTDMKSNIQILGVPAMVDKSNHYVLNQRVGRLIIKDPDSFYNDFFYFQMRTVAFLDELRKKANSGVQVNLTTDAIKSTLLFAPTFENQKRIGRLLRSIEDKIENNVRINENLERQARTLFKSWFVDFEPYKDGDFVETEIGRIPKDLLVKRVSEIPHTIETGRRPKGGVGEISSGVPSVGAEHVKGLGNYDYSKTKYITEEYAASLKTGKVNGYELLIYKDGGKPGYFIPNYSIFGEGYPFDECFLNEHVFKLDFGDKGYNAFCYFYFWTDYVMNYLNAQGGKAAIPGINRQDIENIQIYAPENELVKRFGDIVLPSIRQILFNCKESRRLSQLRDALLPRLMSGELKVNEIEMP